jgi:hypothetical protein
MTDFTSISSQVQYFAIATIPTKSNIFNAKRVLQSQTPCCNNITSDHAFRRKIHDQVLYVRRVRSAKCDRVMLSRKKIRRLVI